jgi:hypothetical protein
MGNEMNPDTHPGPYAVDFTDPRLKRSYDNHFDEIQALSDEQRQVHALMGVYDLAQVLGGFDSPGVHETIWHLLLPQLRPELRRWYQRADPPKNDAAVLLRSYLNSFLREAF